LDPEATRPVARAIHRGRPVSMLGFACCGHDNFKKCNVRDVSELIVQVDEEVTCVLLVMSSTA
jgi:hypothetical protein